MKVLITGGSGFLGQAIAGAAVAAGHDVTTMTRRPSAPVVEGCAVVVGDLRRPGEWVDVMANADAVVHLAATKSGDLHAQLAGTVVATEKLLGAMAELDEPPLLVHASTFSVYDYETVDVGGVLDETTPLEDEPGRRDAYAQTKLLQERLVREYEAVDPRRRVVVLRPGAVWGPGAWWDGGHAFGFGAFDLAVGPGTEMKLTYIENCADAFVSALGAPAAVGETLNIVDDEQPSQRDFESALRQAGVPVRPGVPVPYRLMLALARGADRFNTRFLGNRARVPEFLDPLRMSARYRPLHYPNERAKRILGWTPRYGFAEALQRAVAADPDLRRGSA